MATLTNPRHERFAVLVAAGLPATVAYIQAGFARGGAAQSAARLAKRPLVAGRIAALKAHATDSTMTHAAIDREFVLQGLRGIAMAGQSDSARVKAYELIGRELGMFSEQRNNGLDWDGWDGDLRKLSTPQLEMMVASMDAMAAQEQCHLGPVVNTNTVEKSPRLVSTNQR
jgi:hypothetical protein